MRSFNWDLLFPILYTIFCGCAALIAALSWWKGQSPLSTALAIEALLILWVAIFWVVR